MEESKKKIISQVAIFAVTFIVAFFGTQYLMKGSNSSDKELIKISDDMNKKCPIMVDNETQLDNSKVFDNTLQYNYTLVNVVKNDSSFDLIGAKKFIMKNAQDNLDNRPEMKSYREKKVALKYNYKDKNGKNLFDFTVNVKK
jgi:hypothetical protein